jgi:CDP-diacylglycerol---serine O-phosphatidyltransferase
MNSKYRYAIPNGVTFISLACGVVAIVLAAGGNLVSAGILILASYVLDLVDGTLARSLKAGSDFGLQLDSLADMVSLGTAPAVLAFAYLHGQGYAIAWILPFVLLFVLAGAFRLARFNLLPPKSGRSDSIGLTISTAGATLTLAVLSNIASHNFIPDPALFGLILVLSLLMGSKIHFPCTHQVFSRWRLNFIYICLFGASLVWLQFSLVHTFFLFSGGYVGLSLARAGYKRIDS